MLLKPHPYGRGRAGEPCGFSDALPCQRARIPGLSGSAVNGSLLPKSLFSGRRLKSFL